MNNELKKTTVYLTPDNRKKLRKASYLTEKTLTSLINEILDENLDNYLEKLENDKDN